MSNEKYQWEALLADGTRIAQFDSEGNEVTFKKVVENLDSLFLFRLFNESKEFSVNLTDGSFSVNGQKFFFFDKPAEEFRLIFFKRRRVTAPSTQIETEYWLGWQSTIDGKNQKRLLKIFEEIVCLKEES